MAGDDFREIVRIRDGDATIEGELVLPAGAGAVVLFSHGSGSSRHSPRNKFVAQVLGKAGLGTLLIDLLTPEEDRTYETRFDIDLLTRRLAAATRWLREQPSTQGLGVGYFGASTGAASALRAAADLGEAIGAVVSRGGRPDLAWPALALVQAPTLLIVGGLDSVVIELNEKAYRQIKAEKHLAIVLGATHLFEEPGTLEEVARLASEWFLRHLSRSKAEPRSLGSTRR